MTNLTSTVYRKVVDDVIRNVQAEFRNEGVDENVLRRLQQLWENKIRETGAVSGNSSWDVTEGHGGGGRRAQNSGASMAPPMAHVAPYSQSGSEVVNALPYDPSAYGPGTYPPGADGAGNQLGRPAAYMVQPDMASGQSVLSNLGMGLPPMAHSSASNSSDPAHHPSKRLRTDADTASYSVSPSGGEGSAAAAPPGAPTGWSAHQSMPSISPVKGSGPSGSSSVKRERANALGADDDDDDWGATGSGDADATGEGADKGAAAHRAADEGEPALSDSDDDDGGDPQTHDDLVLAQFDKVTRTKSKWKCVLKDGVAHLNRREYLFQKASGEFDW